MAANAPALSGRPFLVHFPMSKIDLHHSHRLSPEQAREAVQQLADALQTRFGLDCHWQDEGLHFSRPGVEGSITLSPGQLRVEAQLGWLFSALKTQVETEIGRVLREKF